MGKNLNRHRQIQVPAETAVFQMEKSIYDISTRNAGISIQVFNRDLYL